jgi:hypothetical protein
VRNRAAAAGLRSDEHVTLDGTQLEAWASLERFPRRDADRREPPDDPGNPERSSIRRPTARNACWRISGMC